MFMILIILDHAAFLLFSPFKIYSGFLCLLAFYFNTVIPK